MEIPACQFSLFERTAAGQTQTYALSTQAPSDGSLSTWRWYPAATADRPTGTYHALYPRSWYRYQQVFQAQIACSQFSPIWPHNYQEASYPGGGV
jgi:non-lysosomal glucosylceramidase